MDETFSTFFCEKLSDVSNLMKGVEGTLSDGFYLVLPSNITPRFLTTEEGVMMFSPTCMQSTSIFLCILGDATVTNSGISSFMQDPFRYNITDAALESLQGIFCARDR